MQVLDIEGLTYLVEKIKQLKPNGGSEFVNAVDISKGGTGATDETGARENLSVYSKAEIDTKLGDVSTILESITGVSA